MPEEIAVDRVEAGIVDVCLKDTFAEVVENDDPTGATQAPECLFMQIGPDARTGCPGKQWMALRL